VTGRWTPFIKLRDALDERLSPLGLRIIGFSLQPGSDEHSVHFAHVAIEVDPEIAFAAIDGNELAQVDTSGIDRELVDLLQQTNKKHAVEGLLEITRDGIFADDDDEGEA